MKRLCVSSILFVFFAFLVPFVLLPVSTFAGTNIWTSNGPYGGRVSAFVIDPTSPQTVYAGTYNGGLFKSTNGGSSWTAINTGLMTYLAVLSFAIDPTSGQTVYAGTFGGGVFAVTLIPTPSINLSTSSLTMSNTPMGSTPT